MKEPKWLDIRIIYMLHAESLAEHGGGTGLRDKGLLESALSRPLHKWNYAPKTDLAELAAAYGFGLLRNHPFVDGNKRIAFIAAETFLQLNGYSLTSKPLAEIGVMLDVAAGQMSEPEFAQWIRGNVKGRR
jgi:death on curing protein